MNSSPISNNTVQNAANIQTSSTGSSMWINKLKIVGSGQNWAVAPCEPFYLMGTEPPAYDAALTGAKNLIEHYGLASAYQKFCSRPLREELSAFLPHLSGNVDVPASTDGSSLLALIERPPIRGKELRKFAPGQLEQAFRLHPGPLPAEYSALFAAAPQPRNTSRTDSVGQPPDTSTTGLCAGSGSRMPATAAPGLSGIGNAYPPRRRRRYEAARGYSGTPSSSGGVGSANVFGSSGHPTNSFFPGPPPAPVSALVPHNQIPSAPPSTSSSTSSNLPSHLHSHFQHSAHMATTAATSLPPTASTLAVDTLPGSGTKSLTDLPPGLIPVAAPNLPQSHFQSGPSNSEQSTVSQQPPPPPPLLAPVHGSAVPSNSRSTNISSYPSVDASGPYLNQQNVPVPPVLHSIHPQNVTSASPGTTSHHHSHHHHHYHQLGSGHLPIPGTDSVQSYGRWSSPGRGGSGSSPPSPDPYRGRRSDGMDAERRNKKKRKEKKRRKERE